MITPSNSRVDETCSCGATFKATGPFASTSAQSWRTQHRHDRSVGICGMSTRIEGSTSPDPICDLPFGHEGWHEEKGGARWGHRRYQSNAQGGY